MEEEITKLQDLLEMGFIQQDEYEQRIAEIQNRLGQTASKPAPISKPTSTTPAHQQQPQQAGKEEELWNATESVRLYSFNKGSFCASERDLVWDTQNGSKSKELLVVDGGRTVINTSNQSGCLNICRSTHSFSSGKHSWKLHLRNIPPDSAMVVGVCYFDIFLETYVGGGNNGWGYLSATGQKLYSNTFLKYTNETYGNDDVIGVEIDMDEKTLRFNKNGVDLGQAFKISGKVFPAISLPGRGKPSSKGDFPAATFVL